MSNIVTARKKKKQIKPNEKLNVNTTTTITPTTIPTTTTTTSPTTTTSLDEASTKPYDPFSLFEYDNRAIAIQALKRINNHLTNSASPNNEPLLNKNTSSKDRRRTSISSTPISARKSPRTVSSLKSPINSLDANQSESSSKSVSASSLSTVRGNRRFVSTSRSKSDSSQRNHSGGVRPLSSSLKRGTSTELAPDNIQSSCVCCKCGQEQEVKKPLITPTTEIFKALTEIEYEQALKQSMKGIEKVNLNDEEQLDLVAEILSETLLKNDGLSFSKRKQKKNTHFSQTETYFENGIDDRPLITLEKQFDFTGNFILQKKSLKNSIDERC